MADFKPVSHVIFDMDGLLLDTERLYTEAIQTLTRKYGKEYTFELKSQCMGSKAEVGAQKVIDALKLPITVSEYFEQIENLYESLFPGSKLLPDSVGMYHKAHNKTLLQFNVSITWEHLISLMGSTSLETAESIQTHFNLPLSAKEYQSLVAKNYPEFLPLSPMMPGAEKLVHHLHQHSVPIAIASGGSKPYYIMKTQNHLTFFDLFNHIVLASSDPGVKKGKPAPDVFLVCADRFPDKPDPSKCLVFEDAPLGVEASIAAGMQVVMVPDERLSEDKKKNATVVLKSLEDFKPEMFGLPAYSS